MFKNKKQVRRDVHWLRECGLMDYSLIVGILRYSIFECAFLVSFFRRLPGCEVHLLRIDALMSGFKLILHCFFFWNVCGTSCVC